MAASQSYYGKVARRFLRSPLGVIGLVLLLVNIVGAVGYEVIAPYPYAEIHPRDILHEPSQEYPFGTDNLGRDTLSRVIYGARISLGVMTISTGLALVVGVPVGLISGYMGPLADALIMRIIDAWLAFPALILALAIVAILGPGLFNTMIAVAIVNMPRTARLVRGEVLRLREQEYVTAARALGASKRRILLRHIYPGTLGSTIVFASLLASQAIITESSLSFLGLGAQPPEPSWGSMIAMGTRYWNHAWWLSFFPGLAIFLTVFALSFVGDALRDALDVRLGHN
ncbi:MAG: ABC transporter permease [Anaerolineae bacterium]|nr:ABC transporter permease [Anaerolineae bacterium]